MTSSGSIYLLGPCCCKKSLELNASLPFASSKPSATSSFLTCSPFVLINFCLFSKAVNSCGVYSPIFDWAIASASTLAIASLTKSLSSIFVLGAIDSLYSPQVSPLPFVTLPRSCCNPPTPVETLDPGLGLTASVTLCLNPPRVAANARAPTPANPVNPATAPGLIPSCPWFSLRSWLFFHWFTAGVNFASSCLVLGSGVPVALAYV